MKLSMEQRRRAEALLDQLQDVFWANVWSDGRAKMFDELELEAYRQNQ